MSTSTRVTESAIHAFLEGEGTGDHRLDAVLTAMAALPPAPDTAADLITKLAATANDSGATSPTRVRAARSKPLPSRWRRRAAFGTIISSLAGKVAIASVALATTTGGLAATDSLPAPAQQVVSDVAARIGINLPAPNDNAGGNAPSAEDTEAPSELSDETSQEPIWPRLPDKASDTAKNRISDIHGDGGKGGGPPDGKGGGPPDGKGGGPPDGHPGGGPPDGHPGGGPPDEIPAGPPSNRGGGTPASPSSPRP